MPAAASAVVVRPCTDADLEVLVRVWPTSGVHEAHVARAASGDASYLVAWDGEEPLGSGLVRWTGPVGENAAAAFPSAVEICHLQVREGARGRGVGTAIIHRAEVLVVDAGAVTVAVGVSVDNPGAERIYERLGYRRAGVKDVSRYSWTTPSGEVRHEVEVDRLLVKELASPQVRGDAAPAAQP
ncbi:GNAT family N-acetyltransferase [Georgenia sp. Z1344]|uniref:GNAT family N-acetyltransferase n=1 Tax=Georgenia sp. Z1344 TaxID=3416706 RepID=UPI003CF4D84E